MGEKLRRGITTFPHVVEGMIKGFLPKSIPLYLLLVHTGLPKALAIVFGHVISSELKISITRKLVQKLYWVMGAESLWF